MSVSLGVFGVVPVDFVVGIAVIDPVETLDGVWVSVPIDTVGDCCCVVNSICIRLRRGTSSEVGDVGVRDIVPTDLVAGACDIVPRGTIPGFFGEPRSRLTERELAVVLTDAWITFTAGSITAPRI